VTHTTEINSGFRASINALPFEGLVTFIAYQASTRDAMETVRYSACNTETRPHLVKALRARSQAESLMEHKSGQAMLAANSITAFHAIGNAFIASGGT
jgi:hypothetical protein